LAACAVHVALLAALRLVPDPAPLPPRAPNLVTSLEGMEIEVATAPDAPTPERGNVGDRARAGAVAAFAPNVRAPEPNGRAEPTTEPRAPDDVVRAPDEGWTFHPARVDLGIDPVKRPLRGAGAREREGTSTPAGASSTGGLAEALAAHDVALGLGRGGAVNTIVHEAVQASSVMGKAIFVVTFDGAGGVSVHVSSASADEREWARLNESIRASVLAKKDTMRLPTPRSLRVAVEVEAKEQYPNGVKPKDLGTRFVAEGPKVTSTKDHVEIQLPALGFAHAGKVCGIGVLVIPPVIQGGCDPSNIGAVAQRIVTAHIVSESVL
jgi:hypothetical protein